MFCSVIIDINHKNVDRPFTYRVPEGLLNDVKPGVKVLVPFGRGNTMREAYVLSVEENCPFDPMLAKVVSGIVPKSKSIEDELIALSVKIRERYGGTLYQSLSVVLPEKSDVKIRKPRYFAFVKNDVELAEAIQTAEKKKHHAKLRLLQAFSEKRILPASIVSDRLNVPSSTINSLKTAGLLEILETDSSHVDERVRTASKEYADQARPVLNAEQANAANQILSDSRRVHLLYGITGSGKTEVYLKLIEEALKQGKDCIVLIPEISLTYQTVMRFYARFGELVSVVHSRIAKGEKAERFELAKKGEIRVMIGPRSALFTPFKHLGLIIIDEFHDGSYDSDQVPKYNAPEVAIMRAEMNDAKVVFGSATPPVLWYERALRGEVSLETLSKRAVTGSLLPSVSVVDMREELKNKNRSVFSGLLRDKMQETLARNEQVMLFLNRRGYSGAVSCRACGKAVTCPHCSVSLNYHKNGRLKCHICGYERMMVSVCPDCASKLIGTFGTGTEKVEETVKELFPGVRTLRMDADTTSGKDGHEKIIEAFKNHEADVMIGTQMIVKGHDFDHVTLVGILAADLSLLVPDFRSAETTFQLLTQAEGRAGRRNRPGECVIQTYNPEHYAITAARDQDYEAFFNAERLFRQAMRYPPFGAFMGIRIFCADAREVERISGEMEKMLSKKHPAVRFLGPSEDNPYRVKDQYRRMLYVKAPSFPEMMAVKQDAENVFKELNANQKVYMTFES